MLPEHWLPDGQCHRLWGPAEDKHLQRTNSTGERRRQQEGKQTLFQCGDRAAPRSFLNLPRGMVAVASAQTLVMCSTWVLDSQWSCSFDQYTVHRSAVLAECSRALKDSDQVSHQMHCQASLSTLGCC